VQANGPSAHRGSRLLGGYGVVRAGQSVVIADSGLVPPPGFAGEAHAGGLAFEFAHGNELIVGSCGPAPSDMPESAALFRQAIAHSSATIDDEDATDLHDAAAVMALDSAQHMLTMSSHGYGQKFGAEIERRLTLLAEGTTLVGQDRIIAAGGEPRGRIAVRFHLAPGIVLRRNTGDGIARLILPNGRVWSFLWEGAEFHQEDSVRQSAYLGFHRTRQMVLEADVAAGAEIAWIFTLEQQ